MSQRTRTRYTVRERGIDASLRIDAVNSRAALWITIAGVDTEILRFTATALTALQAVGSASDTLGFYGATPVGQPHATAQAAVDTTAITAVPTTAVTAVPTTAITTLVTTPTATDIATAVNSIIARLNLGVVAANSLITQGNLNLVAVNSLVTQSAADVVLANRIRADLVTLGLIKGSN